MRRRLIAQPLDRVDERPCRNLIELPQIQKVEELQNLLIAQATGGDGDNSDYVRLRSELLGDPLTQEALPRFVRTCRDLSQFWQYIK